MASRESVQGMIDGMALLVAQITMQRQASNGEPMDESLADAALAEVCAGGAARAVTAASGVAGIAARWMQQVLAQCDPDLDDPMAFAEDVLRDFAVQLQGMLDAAT